MKKWILLFCVFPMVSFADVALEAARAAAISEPNTAEDLMALFQALIELVQGGQWLAVTLAGVYIMMYFIKKIPWLWGSFGKKYGAVIAIGLSIIAAFLGHLYGGLSLMESIFAFIGGAGAPLLNDLYDAIRVIGGKKEVSSPNA